MTTPSFLTNSEQLDCYFNLIVPKVTQCCPVNWEMGQIDVFGYDAKNLIDLQQPPVFLTDSQQLDCRLIFIIIVSQE